MPRSQSSSAADAQAAATAAASAGAPCAQQTKLDPQVPACVDHDHGEERAVAALRRLRLREGEQQRFAVGGGVASGDHVPQVVTGRIAIPEPLPVGVELVVRLAIDVAVDLGQAVRGKAIGDCELEVAAAEAAFGQRGEPLAVAEPLLDARLLAQQASAAGAVGESLEGGFAAVASDRIEHLERLLGLLGCRAKRPQQLHDAPVAERM
jgi:hypothetical protein